MEQKKEFLKTPEAKEALVLLHFLLLSYMGIYEVCNNLSNSMFLY